MNITKSTRKGKRFLATFRDGTKVHFGAAGASTYIDHQDKQKRAAYIARHRVNEDWTNPKRASTLSRYISWGDYTSMDGNIAAFKRRFNL
jgi:hypothetical protein